MKVGLWESLTAGNLVVKLDLKLGCYLANCLGKSLDTLMVELLAKKMECQKED